MKSHIIAIVKKLECIIRPHKLDEVKTAVAELGIQGMTVLEVRGSGSSPEARESFGGAEYIISLPIKIRLEMIVPDDQVEEVIETVMRHARTGQQGDGKIFVAPLTEAMRIRTGERGDIVL
ncbi:MAG: P-II family nitrogen regulator [bacterium]